MRPFDENSPNNEIGGDSNKCFIDEIFDSPQEALESSSHVQFKSLTESGLLGVVAHVQINAASQHNGNVPSDELSCRD